MLCMMLSESDSFMIRQLGRSSIPRRTQTSKLQMGLMDIFTTLPICENKFASGPSTPILGMPQPEDPTAGMSDDEIQNYVCNVGGGLCGYPEWIKTAVGIGLNLSLLSFGLFTLSYAVLYAVQWVLDKGVEDTLKDADNRNSVTGAPQFAALTSEGKGSTDFSAAMEASEGAGMNRKARRLQEKIKVDLPNRLDELNGKNN